MKITFTTLIPFATLIFSVGGFAHAGEPLAPTVKINEQLENKIQVKMLSGFVISRQELSEPFSANINQAYSRPFVNGKNTTHNAPDTGLPTCDLTLFSENAKDFYALSRFDGIVDHITTGNYTAGWNIKSDLDRSTSLNFSWGHGKDRVTANCHWLGHSTTDWTAASLLKSLKGIIEISSASAKPIAAPAAVKQQTCDWRPASPTNLDPYSACAENKSVIEKLVNDCLRPELHPDLFNNAWLITRLEQMKLIYDKELFYVSRIPTGTRLFKKAWSDFRKRWISRMKDEPYLLHLDTSPKLGRSMCALHNAMGLDCNDQPGIDVVTIKMNIAITEAQNVAAQYKSKPSLTRDLLKAVLTLNAAKQGMKSQAREETYLSDEAIEDKKQKREALKDYVYAYYPELTLSSDLEDHLNDLLETGRVSGNVERAISKLELKANVKDDVSMADKLNVAKQVALSKLSTTFWSAAEETKVEQEFAKSFQGVLENLSQQIQKSRNSIEWTLDQDYLLSSAIDMVLDFQDKGHAGLYQSMICNNSWERSKKEKRTEDLMLIGGTVALLTGAGAMFDVGAAIAAGLITTSVTTINIMSIYDVYATAQEKTKADDLFMVQGTSASQMNAADREFIKSIPWAIVSLAFSAPGFVLEGIQTASKAAQAANDLNRVAKLARYARAVKIVSGTAGAAVAVYNVPSGYRAVKELVHPDATKIH